MERRQTLTKCTGLVAAAALSLLLAVGCGPDSDEPTEAVLGETTVREAPSPPSADDEATRQMLNEMRQRIAEVKDGTVGTR